MQEKKIGLFEISWSTSDFVAGNPESQRKFLEKSFEFYSENESKLEFFTWYRQYDRPEGTCVSELQKIGDEKIKNFRVRMVYVHKVKPEMNQS